jgi:hypothetical protein
MARIWLPRISLARTSLIEQRDRPISALRLITITPGVSS